MCLTGNRKEWLRVSVLVPQGYGSYTVMGCVTGWGAASETGFLGRNFLIIGSRGPLAKWVNCRCVVLIFGLSL